MLRHVAKCVTLLICISLTLLALVTDPTVIVLDGRNVDAPMALAGDPPEHSPAGPANDRFVHVVD